MHLCMPLGVCVSVNTWYMCVLPLRRVLICVWVMCEGEVCVVGVFGWGYVACVETCLHGVVWVCRAWCAVPL